MKFTVTPEGKVTRCIKEMGDSLDLIIPEVIDGISVTSIGWRVFFPSESLRSVVLPKTLESIGNYAFYECSNLQSLEFPEGLVSIGDSAFACCDGLKALVFPEKLTSIGDDAFVCCSHLESVVFPKGLTSIGDFAFARCEALQSIELPQGFALIHPSVFRYSRMLQSVFVANPAEVARVRGLLPEHLHGLVKVNPWSPLRSAWIGAMVFGGRVDPRFATDSEEPLSAGAPAGGGGSGAALG
jgi:hypothetical protein